MQSQTAGRSTPELYGIRQQQSFIDNAYYPAAARARRISLTRATGSSRLAMHGLEFPVDAQLHATDGKEIDPGLGLAGLDRFTDTELPLPDALYRRLGHSELDAPVIHGLPPRFTVG
jgi:hypothetical protein